MIQKSPILKNKRSKKLSRRHYHQATNGRYVPQDFGFNPLRENSTGVLKLQEASLGRFSWEREPDLAVQTKRPTDTGGSEWQR